MSEPVVNETAHVDVLIVVDGVDRDFFMRQLWDWKASAEIEIMENQDLSEEQK